MAKFNPQQLDDIPQSQVTDLVSDLAGKASTSHTHTASDVTDFDTEVSNNTDVTANTTARHDAVTVSDTSEIDLTLTGQQISGSIVAGSIDETKLDTSTNASLDLADSASQPGHTHTESEITDLDHSVDVVSNVATSRILGRTTAGSGDSEELTAAQTRTLLNVEDGATSDQTDAEIKTAYENNANTNAFTDADETKLDGIEAGADVTDTANVTSAGALMDSEVDADIKTLSLPANTTISTFGASLIDDASATAARTTLGVDAAGTDNSTDVTLAGTPDYLTLSGQEITLGQVDLTTDVTGVLPDANVADDITLTNITQITNRSHTDLTDIGTNTHAQIDTHIADGTLHFTEGSIDHGSIAGLTDDDHSQYLLSAGRTGGQTVFGGLDAADNLALWANDETFDNLDDGRIRLESMAVIDKTITLNSFNQAVFFNIANYTALRLQGTFTTSGDNNANVVGYQAVHTLTYDTNQLVNSSPLFQANFTIEPTAGVTDTNTFWAGFSSVPGYVPNLSTAVTATTNFFSGYDAEPFSNMNASSHASSAGVVQSLYGYGAFTLGLFAPAEDSRNTVDNASGFLMLDPRAGSGTVTNLYGLNISEKLTQGTNNFGIRNKSTTAFDADAQTITAAGNTIVADATIKRLNNTSGGSVTLTSTPTIANGHDGQTLILYNSSAQNVVLQRHSALASSNLRLGAATRTLGQYDTLTLIFDATNSEWIEISFVNNT